MGQTCFRENPTDLGAVGGGEVEPKISCNEEVLGQETSVRSVIPFSFEREIIPFRQNVYLTFVHSHQGRCLGGMHTLRGLHNVNFLAAEPVGGGRKPRA